MVAIIYYIAVRIFNFVGKIFVFLVGKKISWGNNFCGHSGMVGTIVVEYARY